MKDFIGEYSDVVPTGLCDWLIEMIDQSHTIDCRDTENRSPWRSDRQIIMESFAPGEAGDLMGFVGKCLKLYVDENAPALQNHTFASSTTLLQKTVPMQGYHAWHCDSDKIANSRRMMVSTLYLNTVEKGGETEFLYQSMRVTPEQGTLALWPAYWTHPHRGNPPLEGEKYIMNGWLEYLS